MIDKKQIENYIDFIRVASKLNGSDFLGVYSGCWKDRTDVEEAFDITLSDEVILAAGYEYASYEGDCSVLFFQNGKFYIVQSYHCSCNGFEGSWRPEETSLEYLVKAYKDNLGEVGRIRTQVKQILEFIGAI